jgi:hypothetical protein
MSNMFIVMLRRPRNKRDARTDPFWEFGSFGCTSCHQRNLLHPKNCQIKAGDRLAFVQGGHLGPRLLLVTPPVTRIDHPGGGPNGRVELRWPPDRQPFRYDRAPSLFERPAPGKPGLFPLLADTVANTNRATVDAKFASRFRARSSPLAAGLTHELDSGFDAAIESAAPSDFITYYADALPWCGCPSSVVERHQEYQQWLKELDHPRCVEQQTVRCCE